MSAQTSLFPELTTRAAAEDAQPLIKWVGGKRQLLPEIRTRLPASFHRYIEPFMGGAALFFELASAPNRRFKTAILADTNPELVALYTAVRDDLATLLTHLRAISAAHIGFADMASRRVHYNSVRSDDPSTMTGAARGARFIFLNRTCFNGIWRVNANGRFNVPFGKYDSPRIVDEPTLRACADALAGVEVHLQDFVRTALTAEAGDFVYFDPPYVPLSETSSFVGYAKERFDGMRQLELRDVARTLVERGVHVLLSNSSAPLVYELYAGPRFRIDEVDARRALNSATDKRGAVKEVLITGVAP